MSQSDPLKAIEKALANEAESEHAAAKVKEWLALRKECLDQNAAQSRTTFWRVVLIVALIAAVVFIAAWIIAPARTLPR